MRSFEHFYIDSFENLSTYSVSNFPTTCLVFFFREYVMNYFIFIENFVLKCYKDFLSRNFRRNFSRDVPLISSKDYLGNFSRRFYAKFSTVYFSFKDFFPTFFRISSVENSYRKFLRTFFASFFKFSPKIDSFLQSIFQ